MIFFETSIQARVFLLLIWGGMGTALVYDLLSPLRKRSRGGMAAADLLFCLLAGALCFFALALGGENRLRLYALLGLFFGAGIYRLGVRRIVIRIGHFFKRKPSPEKEAAGKANADGEMNHP